MSVFTEVAGHELEAWLAACGAGPLRGFHGVEGGVENTTLHVLAGAGEFVLTLFEWQPATAAERTLALTARLADAGLPVARPWPQPGGWTAPLAGKPAALAAWIDGTHPDAPSTGQCAAIGGFLGRLHSGSASRHGSDPIDDLRGAGWCRRAAEAVKPSLTPGERALLDAALADSLALPALPEGTLHADLFRDNALFDGDTLNGVIDFHYACTGPFAYDVAVATLDWCADDGGFDPARTQALCRAYAAARAPGADERAAFPRLMRRAALRFWLSRACDLSQPRPGRDVQVKDPVEMRARLQALRETPLHWPA